MHATNQETNITTTALQPSGIKFETNKQTNKKSLKSIQHYHNNPLVYIRPYYQTSFRKDGDRPRHLVNEEEEEEEEQEQEEEEEQEEDDYKRNW
jgi:hypothetical protein